MRISAIFHKIIAGGLSLEVLIKIYMDSWNRDLVKA